MKSFFALALWLVWEHSAVAQPLTNRVADAVETAGAGPPVALTPDVIRQFVAELRTNHPSLRAAGIRAQAAGTNVLTIRTWDDPKLLLAGAIDTPRGFKPSEEGNLIYGLEQKLPLFGKAAAARQQAQAEADTAMGRAGQQLQMVRRDLVRALYTVALDDYRLVLSQQDLAWLELMAATTEQQFRSGQASQVEVLRLQNERARRTNEWRTDIRHRDHARLTINRLLNRDLHASLPLFALPPVVDAVPYSDGLVQLALANEPRLAVMRREIRAAEAAVEVTRRSRHPEVNALADTRLYSGDGGVREVTLGVSVTLPWFNRSKYRADLDRDRRRLEAVELDATDQQLTVREELHQLTVLIETARRDALLYRDEILPRSEAALTAAQANWTARRGMFLDIMEARRQLLEGRVAYAKAVTDEQQALADLALWCGVEDADTLLKMPELISPSTDVPRHP